MDPISAVSGNQKDGITTITYRRPLAAKEAVKDKEILSSRSQSVIAAFGPLNSRYEANAHSFMDTTRNDVQLDFGAQVQEHLPNNLQSMKITCHYF